MQYLFFKQPLAPLRPWKHPQYFTGDQHPAGSVSILQVNAEQFLEAAHPIVDGVAVEVQFPGSSLYAAVLAEVAEKRFQVLGVMGGVVLPDGVNIGIAVAGQFLRGDAVQQAKQLYLVVKGGAKGRIHQMPPETQRIQGLLVVSGEAEQIVKFVAGSKEQFFL